MSKEEFFDLSEKERDKLVLGVLVKVVYYQALFKNFYINVNIFSDEDFEILKIILGAYTNGVLIKKEEES